MREREEQPQSFPVDMISRMESWLEERLPSLRAPQFQVPKVKLACLVVGRG